MSWHSSSPSRSRSTLNDDDIVWLTTVTPGGRPAPRPVWFAWDGAVITIYTQPDGAKVRHLGANDQVALNFNSTPSGTDVAVISGRAARRLFVSSTL